MRLQIAPLLFHKLPAQLWEWARVWENVGPTYCLFIGRVATPCEGNDAGQKKGSPLGRDSILGRPVVVGM